MNGRRKIRSENETEFIVNQFNGCGSRYRGFPHGLICHLLNNLDSVIPFLFIVKKTHNAKARFSELVRKR